MSTVLEYAPLPHFDVVARQAVYLGLDPLDGYRPCWSNARDSIGVVGPPGYGKSSGILMPTLMSWDGPAVVTSTRPDLLRFSGPTRPSRLDRLTTRGGRWCRGGFAGTSRPLARQPARALTDAGGDGLPEQFRAVFQPVFAGGAV